MSATRSAVQVIIDALAERDGYGEELSIPEGYAEEYSRLAHYLLGKLSEELLGPVYDSKWVEFAYPYSKPMHLEQNAELDGIESAARWLEGKKP